MSVSVPVSMQYPAQYFYSPVAVLVNLSQGEKGWLFTLLPVFEIDPAVTHKDTMNLPLTTRNKRMPPHSDLFSCSAHGNVALPIPGFAASCGKTMGRYHGGRRRPSDDTFHSPTVIPPSALDKPCTMKRYYRR